MVTRTRCKICGITNIDDALLAIDAGADALGFVFYDKSPRYVSPEEAATICAQLPPFVTRVGLFVDHSAELVTEISKRVELDLLQFHGDESPEFCKQFDRPYIKAVRVRADSDFAEAQARYTESQALLVDTYRVGVPGGTGEAFDWGLLPAERSLPLILAGGLNPDNVRRAIATVSPYAVDVSGGVEREKGKKDGQKVLKFLEEVMRER